jgi:hypothetical protein
MSIGSGIGTEQVGLGEAQVLKPFDNSQLREEERIRRAQEAADKKAQQARVGDINKNLKSLHNIDIMPKDQELFAKEGKGIYDYTKKNWQKLAAGDVDAEMELQQQIADYQQKAALSKNARERYESETAKIGDFKALRPESEQYLIDFADKKTAGDWNFNPNAVRKNIPITEIIKGAKAIKGEKIESGYGYKDPVTGASINVTSETYTPERAGQDVEKLLTDHNVYEQMAYNLQNEVRDQPELAELYKTKDGSLDVVKYAKEKLIPTLEVNNKKQTSSGGGDKGGLEFNFGNGTAENENWNFASGEKTQEEKKSAIQMLFGGGTDVTKYDYIAVHPKKTSGAVAMFPDPKNDKKEFAGVPMGWLKDRKTGDVFFAATDKNTNKIKMIPEYQLTADNKALLGTTYNELEEGGIMKRKETSAKKETQADWNKKWSSLKRGESMLGLDGKTYTKK